MVEPRLTLPLFVFEGDDLLVFPTVERALESIEPVDARDAGYEGFDAEGAIIEVRGIGIQRTGRVLRTVTGGTTVLRPTGERDPEAFRQRLAAHVNAIGKRRFGLGKTDLDDLDLDSLVVVVARFHADGS